MGLNVSNGQYIMFCDSDDYVAADWCETLFKMINNFPNAWCVSDIYRVNMSDEVAEYKEYKSANEISENNIIYFEVYKMGLSAYAVNKIYRLDILKEKKIRFNEDRALGEDVIFNIKHFKNCEEIKFCKKLYTIIWIIQKVQCKNIGRIYLNYIWLCFGNTYHS